IVLVYDDSHHNTMWIFKSLMLASYHAIAGHHLVKIEAAHIHDDHGSQATLSIGIDKVSFLEPQCDLVILLVNVKTVNAGSAVNRLAVDPDRVESENGRRDQIQGRGAA